jgi:hypothetical protein
MAGRFFNPGGGLAAGEIPVGGVVAWLKTFPNCPGLPANFVECNGQSLNSPGSLFHGQTIPDLNGNSSPNRFLRGATASGTTGGTTCHSHTVCVSLGSSTCFFVSSGGTTCALTSVCVSGVSVSGANAEPPYYTVVWIMRVK